MPVMKKVAIVHDWLTVYAGAERVLEQMLLMYPQADLFSVCDFLPAHERAFLQGKTPRTTFIQHLPGARKRYRSYLPLMPLAIEQLDLSAYDLVLSSSHAVAKGVLTGPNQLHVSYVHSPIRYAWDLQHQYLRESGLDKGVKGWVAKWLLHKMRLWDARTANGVDQFVANSAFIARRIWKTYRREADVVYPPVDVEAFAFREDKEDFYLTASRLVPYKRVSLIVEAFAQMPDKRLKVIGDGPEREKIERIAFGHSNIELLGYQSADALVSHMGRARAFVFAAEEDFGIAPVEAQACGTPVIAFGRGGALESVHDLAEPEPTGLFFGEQSVSAIVQAVERFEREGRAAIQAEDCRRNAERFAPERFRKTLGELVEREWGAVRRR
jgi:glycosyltransferase involved in cell wall biosynthesis